MFFRSKQCFLNFPCFQHCPAVMRDTGNFDFAPVEFPAICLRKFLSVSKARAATFQTEASLQFGGGGTVEFRVLWINVLQGPGIT